MKNGQKSRWLVSVAMALLVLLPNKTSANELSLFKTVTNTDIVAAGVGGLSATGTGTITLSGVSGSITKAYLYWQGPTKKKQPTAIASVFMNGQPVTGTNIGFSGENCRAFNNSQAYRADVTQLVTGNGAYELTGFKTSTAEALGASLIVFFDDGNPANNRDVLIYDGNDSNMANPFDADGWNANFSFFTYTAGGTVSLQLHAADGQAGYSDPAVILTNDAMTLPNNVLAPAGAIFSGLTVPSMSSTGDSTLWDIKTFDITSFLTAGPNNMLALTSGVDQLFEDCIGLIVAIVSLPPSTALESQISFLASPDQLCLGEPVTITARVVDSTGAPVFGTSVNFSITSGPDAPQNVSGVTDINGSISFTYNGLVAGTDQVQACMTRNGTTQCATKTQQWNACSNRAPDVRNAKPSISCLWPPNHQFVNISILGVTDPDGDPVTIKVTKITSDEPTATAQGAGGIRHVPDAKGVGTDTASLRAERSGLLDGRVYEISFEAGDGTGMKATGTVKVNVPTDMKNKSCPAVNSGQFFDATK